MSDRLQALLASKNCREVCEAAVRRLWTEELAKRRNEKEADKAVRAAVHQMTGAFLTPEQLKTARGLLTDYLSGREEALDEALRLHASSRERLPCAQALYSAIFEVTGRPERILDLACGFNPLYLGAQGYRVTGYDVHKGAVELINEWANACSWSVRALCADLLGENAFERADLALMMKLLPVLEQQEKGAGVRLLAEIPAAWRAVTFPLRTRGGRSVGMEKHYSDWMEANVPEGLTLHSRLIVDNELIYLFKEDC